MKTLKDYINRPYDFGYYPCGDNIKYSLKSYVFYTNSIKTKEKVLYSNSNVLRPLQYFYTKGKSCSLRYHKFLTWFDSHRVLEGYDNLTDIVGSHNIINFKPTLKNMCMYKHYNDYQEMEEDFINGYTT